MRIAVSLRRFLLPAPVVTLIAWFRYRAAVSPRAEVELSPHLRLGRQCRISSFVKLKASEGPVTIGARTDVGIGCFIGGHEHGIHIGEDCLISPHASIVGVNYRYDRIDRTFREQGLVSKGPIRIGNNVWVGAGAVILDDSHIEDGAIIAPNSVVSGHIAANVIAQGNPAKPVFTRR
jgi:acetyltransferase-like isoleucine patch superfamily enzyme